MMSVTSIKEMTKSVVQEGREGRGVPAVLLLLLLVMLPLLQAGWRHSVGEGVQEECRRCPIEVQEVSERFQSGVREEQEW